MTLPLFDGVTATTADDPRLVSLLELVRGTLLANRGRFLSLDMITSMVESSSTASVSARIRDLRKPKHGGLKVERRHAGNGVWQYRIPSPCSQAAECYLDRHFVDEV